ncbi:MAG: hypothetical protein ACO3LE_09960, partial [Bdellovibrionota bacterium]
ANPNAKLEILTDQLTQQTQSLDTQLEKTQLLLKKHHRLEGKPSLKKKDLQALERLFSDSKELSSHLKTQLSNTKILIALFHSKDFPLHPDLQQLLDLYMAIELKDSPSIASTLNYLTQIQGIVAQIPDLESFVADTDSGKIRLSELQNLKNSIDATFQASQSLLKGIDPKELKATLDQKDGALFKKIDIAQRMIGRAERLNNSLKAVGMNDSTEDALYITALFAFPVAVVALLILLVLNLIIGVLKLSAIVTKEVLQPRLKGLEEQKGVLDAGRELLRDLLEKDQGPPNAKAPQPT